MLGGSLENMPSKKAGDTFVPRKQPKQSRSKDLVDAILTAASRVLTQSGYEDVSTKRVSEVAGVSVGSLYQYFPNRESLVAGVIERLVDRNVRKLEARLDAAQGLSPEQAIEMIVSFLVNLFLDDSKLLKILFKIGRPPRLRLGLAQPTE